VNLLATVEECKGFVQWIPCNRHALLWFGFDWSFAMYLVACLAGYGGLGSKVVAH